MPKLARLRLVSIGHPSARFGDITLDFRDADARATDATVWLRNGGGKSSLLNLFFALVRPDRREFLGNRADAKQRRLEDYVLPKDHSVVLAEWDSDATANGDGVGDRYLTGVFYEWGGAAGAEAGQLRHLFFAGRSTSPATGFSLDDLPLLATVEGGRVARRTLSSFRQELAAIRERLPHLQIFWTPQNKEWAEHLTSAGIDPELFTYQIRMNAREGGADEVFRFADHDQFVDFLLTLALDSSLGDRVTANIDTYRQELRDRKDEWLPELDLVKGLAERLSPLVGVRRDRSTWIEQVSACGQDLDGLLLHIKGRTEVLASDLERARAKEIETRERLDNARASTLSERRRATSLRLHAAECRHALAIEEAKRARQQLDAAVQAVRLWEAAVPLSAARAHSRRADAYRVELEHKLAQFAPDRDALDAAATALAGTLRAAAHGRREAAKQEALRAEAERRKAKDLRMHAGDARAKVAVASERARSCEGRISELAVERARLERAGVLQAGEHLSVATSRLEAARVELAARAEGLDERGRNLGERVERLHQDSSTARADAAGAEERARGLREDLREGVRLRSELERDDDLRRELETETVDLLRVPPGIVHQLNDGSRISREHVIGRRVARAGDERSVAHLEADGLLPPTPDVQRVIAALHPHVMTAWSGWTFIETNFPREGRRDQATACPAMAAGVVVRDADFDRALAILGALTLELETPVVVAPQRAFEGSGHTEFRVFGPLGDGLFDRAAAEQELRVRRSRLARYDSEIANHERRAGALQRLATRIETFFERFPAGWFTDQESRISSEEAAYTREAKRAAALDEEASGVGKERARIAGELLTTRDEHTAVEKRIIEARSFSTREEKLAEWEEERKAALLTVAESQTVHDDAIAHAEVAEREASSVDAQANVAREEATGLEFELRSVEYARGDEAVACGPLDLLRDEYRTKKAIYEERVGADGLLQLQKRESEQAAEQRERFIRIARPYELIESDVVAALAELPDGASPDDRLRDANVAHSSANGLVGNRGALVVAAKEKVDEARKRAQEVGATPLTEFPAGPNQADEEASEADRRAETLTKDADVIESELSALMRACAEGKGRLDLLTEGGKRAASVREAYADLLPITAPAPLLQPPTDDEIAARIDSGEQVLRTARAKRTRLDEGRQQAIRALRAFAGEPRFESLRSLLARKLVEAEPEDLERLAEQHISDLDARRIHLEGQIESIDRHRDTLISEALNAAEEGLTLLRTAASQSRLPDHVPGLGGAHFLRITTHAVDDVAERRARVATLIDEVCDSGAMPSGLVLVQRAVRRLARPIKVHVLHPDPRVGREAVEIPEIARCSGGEQLTSAILLYCTLAQVRARTRGALRKGTSVLILDNPIGRASRARFLELQREVARAMGVQLLYTTGVNDYDALRALPKIVRLRNQRLDRTSGHQVVEHEGGAEVEAIQIGRAEDAIQAEES